MKKLEAEDKAKPFQMSGAWSGKIRGEIPIGPDGTLGQPSIDWFANRR